MPYGSVGAAFGDAFGATILARHKQQQDDLIHTLAVQKAQSDLATAEQAREVNKETAKWLNEDRKAEADLKKEKIHQAKVTDYMRRVPAKGYPWAPEFTKEGVELGVDVKSLMSSGQPARALTFGMTPAAVPMQVPAPEPPAALLSPDALPPAPTMPAMGVPAQDATPDMSTLPEDDLRRLSPDAQEKIAIGRAVAANKTPPKLSFQEQIESTFLREKFGVTPENASVAQRQAAAAASEDPKERAALQRHISERNYDVAHPIADPNTKLTKVETVDPTTGKAVIKFLTHDELQGHDFKKPTPGIVENRLASATAVYQTGNDIVTKLADPAYAKSLGVAMGRFSNLQDFIGNPPPEFSELAGQIESYSLANMGVHGMRSTQGAEMIKKLLSQPHTPESIVAAVKGLNSFSAHFLENEGHAVPGAPSTTDKTETAAARAARLRKAAGL